MREGWTYKKLGEVSTNFDSLRKPVTKSERKGGIYPYYGASGVQDYVENYIFDGRYLLIGEDGAKWGAGDKSAYIITGKSWVNNHVHILKIDKTLIDTFVEYYLVYSDLNQYITGAIVPKLTQKNLNVIPIPVPPLSTQQQIVEELDLLSGIIEKQKAQLKELDCLAQSLFYDMFGDPVTNEKGWEVKKLGEIGFVERGAGISKKDFVNEGLPCIHYGQLHTILEPTTKQHYTSIPESLLPKYKIAHTGDLIMAITSEDVEGSCKSTAWLGNYDIVVGSDAAILHHEQDGTFLSYYTMTKAFFDEKSKYAKGFKVTHISTKEIESIPVYLPPLPLQQQFAERIASIEHQKTLIQQQLKETETLFNSRMDYYFN